MISITCINQRAVCLCFQSSLCMYSVVPVVVLGCSDSCVRCMVGQQQEVYRVFLFLSFYGAWAWRDKRLAQDEPWIHVYTYFQPRRKGRTFLFEAMLSGRCCCVTLALIGHIISEFVELCLQRLRFRKKITLVNIFCHNNSETLKYRPTVYHGYTSVYNYYHVWPCSSLLSTGMS